MNVCFFIVSLFAVCAAHAKPFTGPDEWKPVHADAIAKWQAEQAGKKNENVRIWNGVVADRQQRTVRLLAEAVGHAKGVTTEFLLVGPASDRAYEAAAVTIAKPSDIVQAMQSLGGLARGEGAGSRPFSFWPRGERMSVTVRNLSDPDGKEEPLQSLVSDTGGEPLLGSGIVFTGGRWDGDACLTDTQQPCSVISLYNDAQTIFDVPFQAPQGTVYGRISLAKPLPYGQLLEVTITSVLAKDGLPRVRQLEIWVAQKKDEIFFFYPNGEDRNFTDTLAWMKAKDAEGLDLFITLRMHDDLPLAKAIEVARVFCMLDGKGIKLDGRGSGDVYPRAFLPQEKWREREGRTPQPFEIHITPNADGTFAKKLTFIEEDWTVEGLDPKLTPKDFPFNAWDELPALVEKAGGKDNKVQLLFVFVPSTAQIKDFMPAIRTLTNRLPLVYIFGN